ncbi:immediate early response gene 2 protein-like [Salvelinus namaycush]|uniref:Immediate early response gene 2 protein-like n=1 Tax=Salvelinus namaycush TaxID=8040 RepID=A0A8U0P165_SALNM|nr:immediate early response gene 2 protein-like [Salvelinus namaycush]XP_038817136.1 immediate early response gene 2 protein-like [Salvelinus namaycush]
MDVSAEAKRIMAVSISKLYASRAQRGGMRLHRSLLLSVVMRSARDLYHSACLAKEREELGTAHLVQVTPEEGAMDTTASGEQVEVEVSQVEPESPLTPTIQEPMSSDSDAAQGACKTRTFIGKETVEDKENRSPVSPDRHSRKRRGKASVAPDFLPSKRARLSLELGEERVLRTGRRTCCRAGDAFTTLSLNSNRAIAAF